MNASTSYRTLLALHPAHDPPGSFAPLVALARALDAHVHAYVLESVSPIPTMTFALNPEHGWSESFVGVLERTARRGEELETYLGGEGVDARVEAEALQLGAVASHVVRRALYADLVVVRASHSLVSGALGQALEGALFGAGRAALVLPDDERAPPVAPAVACVAWDGGREAARAVRESLPFLRAASSVRVVVVEDDARGELERGVRLLVDYLERHDVMAEIERVAPAGRFVAHALVEHVDDSGPDLLVMGAYGHARLRERLFSGATRAALTELDVPLFLAH